MTENNRHFPPGPPGPQVSGEETEQSSETVPPLLPAGHLMSNMMTAGAGAGGGGGGQAWAGVSSHYQAGFGPGSGSGHSSAHSYPYMYGYRYPPYENSPYWYRGYPSQSVEAETEAPPAPPPPCALHLLISVAP